MEQQTGPLKRTPLHHLSDLFDASALGSITILLLGGSFLATWRGMQDFITGTAAETGAASTGLVLLIVFTLTLAMYIALRESISPYYVRGWWSAIWKRVLAGILYAILALWSIGFGYGFWWSLIVGPTITQTELTEIVQSTRAQTIDVQARIAAAASTMRQAELLSDEKAAREAARGGTCGIASPPGDGPLARARDETQAQIANLSRAVRQEWLVPLTGRLEALEENLDDRLNRPLNDDDRQAAFEALDRKLRATASDIAANATARGRTIAGQLQAKAAQLSDPPSDNRVAYCYDPDLAASLQTAADELNQTFEITVSEFRFSEGANGVARAVEVLWLSLGHMVGLVHSTQPEPSPLMGRGLIAFVAALGLDLALLIFSLLQGRSVRSHTQSSASAGLKIRRMQRGQGKGHSSERPMPDRVSHTPTRTIIDAEFTPIDTDVRRLTSSHLIDDDEINQLDPDERLNDLLLYLEEGYAALKLSDNKAHTAQINQRIRDILSALRQVGWVKPYWPDGLFDPDFHMTEDPNVYDQDSWVIVDVLCPGFEDANGHLQQKAKVVAALGPASNDANDIKR